MSLHNVISKELTTHVYWIFFDNYLFIKSEHDHRIQLKVKHLVIHTNQEALTDNEIKTMVLKTSRSWLVKPIH